MRLLINEELKDINGGAMSGTLINAVVRGVTFIFEIGRALGSSLLRLSKHKICKI